MSNWSTFPAHIMALTDCQDDDHSQAMKKNLKTTLTTGSTTLTVSSIWSTPSRRTFRHLPMLLQLHVSLPKVTDRIQQLPELTISTPTLPKIPKIPTTRQVTT